MRILFSYYKKNDSKIRTKVIEGICGESCREQLKNLEPDLDHIKSDTILQNGTEGQLSGGFMLCNSK